MSDGPRFEATEQLTLRNQLFRECEAMARYALASGMKVPGSLLQSLDALTPPSPPQEKGATRGEGNGAQTQNRTLNREGGTAGLNNADVKQLALIHARLAQIVAPATPHAILLLATESARKSIGRFLGPVPLVRGLMLTALLCLILFMAVSLSDLVDQSSVSGDVLNLSGWVLFFNLLFFVAAAGLGASFAALFQVNYYIANGTYDPRYASSYWIRFALGIIAGLILAVLVPIDMEGNHEAIAKPTLAMLGGFSSAVVYRILNRLVETLESLVRGETRAIEAAQEQLARARVTEQLVQSRMELAANLISLQQQLSDGVSTEELKGRVARILDDLMPLELPQQEAKKVAPAGKDQSQNQ